MHDACCCFAFVREPHFVCFTFYSPPRSVQRAQYLKSAANVSVNKMGDTSLTILAADITSGRYRVAGKHRSWWAATGAGAGAAPPQPSPSPLRIISDDFGPSSPSWKHVGAVATKPTMALPRTMLPATTPKPTFGSPIFHTVTPSSGGSGSGNGGGGGTSSGKKSMLHPRRVIIGTAANIAHAATATVIATPPSVGGTTNPLSATNDPWGLLGKIAEKVIVKKQKNRKSVGGDSTPNGGEGGGRWDRGERARAHCTPVEITHLLTSSHFPPRVCISSSSSVGGATAPAGSPAASQSCVSRRCSRDKKKEANTFGRLTRRRRRNATKRKVLIFLNRKKE